ncbi:bifunctional 3,4-dihydroxy-2-butanone-4-phosphate synthase/GTP cyclohydrolase II [Streptomyces sp. GXMU-J15]|uniref:Riboflavin biosynthesis protein RibBA n=1 Tax=Streptomyces fuscus TaxID=3048495 RepID=A0ABT7J5V8_9ACTN|nr:bifunctional 3,4-dihydroxy-2-butanone-4-phosphate synthase/GTP cyclohydrolase II [Streptomyces fuscus]MDL2080251.1 bifunctional 3,4-dihydroxy-2-butanone-4-phosphate synthase/GTP cyclohydrolase II [Streptomyces fuscus]
MSTSTALYGTENIEDWSLDPVEQAIADIAAGRPVVVVDDENRENEGDLIVAAEKATPEIVAFMMRECRGMICAPMEGEELDRLGIPLMVENNTESMRTAFTVTVDAAPVHGVTTGISASDRSTTLQLLASGKAESDDFVRPGHIFPLRARPGGVLVRDGHTEAAVDLARLAGLRPAGAIVEIAGDDGRMLRLPDLIPFARKHGLSIISIEDLIAYRRATEAPAAEATAAPQAAPAAAAPVVRREAEVHLPTGRGTFTAYGYRSTVDGIEHVALVHGDIGDGRDVLVRVHSECLTGDVFGSQRCDCGPQLDAALERIQAEGRGIVVYLRGHEGRGIGLMSKLRAYELQERGRDTLDANLELGLPADARDYAAGARILRDLGIVSVRLMTNNPDKTDALVRHGIEVTDREPMPVTAGEHNIRYLRTKRDRMGHDLPWLEAAPVSACGNQ